MSLNPDCNIFFSFHRRRRCYSCLCCCCCRCCGVAASVVKFNWQEVMLKVQIVLQENKFHNNLLFTFFFFTEKSRIWSLNFFSNVNVTFVGRCAEKQRLPLLVKRLRLVLRRPARARWVRAGGVVLTARRGCPRLCEQCSAPRTSASRFTSFLMCWTKYRCTSHTLPAPRLGWMVLFFKLLQILSCEAKIQVGDTPVGFVNTSGKQGRTL